MCLAVPGKVESRGDRDGLPMAQVRFGSLTREVCLSFVPDAQPGDWVIVHVGMAIQRLDEAAAQQTLALLDALPGAEP